MFIVARLVNKFLARRRKKQNLMKFQAMITQKLNNQIYDSLLCFKKLYITNFNKKTQWNLKKKMFQGDYEPDKIDHLITDEKEHDEFYAKVKEAENALRRIQEER
jgi:hypothetical protein